MPIITISSDSYEKGLKIAKKAADLTGYNLLSREILVSVAEEYEIPEIKLVKVLDERPSALGIGARLRDRCLAYIQEATLSQLLQDNVVCYGLAAHLYVLGVSHVLKVRILSNVEERVRLIASRENVPPEKAKKLIERIDKLRRRWSLDTFAQDETDPSLYDLVISLSQMEEEDALKIITDTAGARKFQPMTYSLKCLQDKELAGRVRVALFERFPDVKVQADNATVIVETKALKRNKRKKTEAIKNMAGQISGVSYVEVHVVNDIFRQAAESSR